MSCKIGEKTNGACTLDDGDFKGLEYGDCGAAYQTFQKAGQAPWTAEDLKKIEDAYKAFSATPLRICSTSEAHPSTIGLMAKTPREIEAATKLVADALAVTPAAPETSDVDWLKLGLSVFAGLSLVALGVYFLYRRESKTDAPQNPRSAEDLIETKIIELPAEAAGRAGDRMREILLAVSSRFPELGRTQMTELADLVERYRKASSPDLQENGSLFEASIKQGLLEYIDVLAGRDDIRTIDLLMRGMTPVYDPSTGVFSGDIVDAQGNGAYPICEDDKTPVDATIPEIMAAYEEIGNDRTLVEGPRPVDRLKPRQVDRVTRDFKAAAPEKTVSEKRPETEELKKR
ncbi:MAG TPA: hypothetical protein VFX30_14410 [bacterium]|nr:hypothetical protein [bacterium]